MNNPTPNLLRDRLLTVTVVAKYLNVDTSSVRRWIKQGILPAIKLPSTGTHARFRIKTSTLVNLLEEGSNQGDTNHVV